MITWSKLHRPVTPNIDRDTNEADVFELLRHPLTSILAIDLTSWNHSQATTDRMCTLLAASNCPVRDLSLAIDYDYSDPERVKAVMAAASKNLCLENLKVRVEIEEAHAEPLLDVLDAATKSCTHLWLKQTEAASSLTMESVARKLHTFQKMETLILYDFNDTFLLIIFSELSKASFTKLTTLCMVGTTEEGSPLQNSLLGLGEFVGSLGASGLKKLDIRDDRIIFDSRVMEGLIIGLRSHANIKNLMIVPSCVCSSEAAGILATYISSSTIGHLTLEGETTIGDEQSQICLFKSLEFKASLFRLEIRSDLFENGGAGLLEDLLVHTLSLVYLSISDYNRVDSAWIKTVTDGLVKNSTLIRFDLFLIEARLTPLSLEPLIKLLLAFPDNKSKLNHIKLISDSLDDKAVTLLLTAMCHPQWRIERLTLGGNLDDRLTRLLFSEPQKLNPTLAMLDVIICDTFGADSWGAIASALSQLKLSRIAVQSESSIGDNDVDVATQALLLEALQLNQEIEGADFFFCQLDLTYMDFRVELDKVCMRNVAQKVGHSLNSGKLPVEAIPGVLTYFEKRWPLAYETVKTTMLYSLLQNRPDAWKQLCAGLTSTLPYRRKRSRSQLHNGY